MLSAHYQRLKTSKRIGVFDSGLGGLTVLAKLKNLSSVPSLDRQDPSFPQFIYLADTARCPYGNREPHELLTFVDEIVAWLTDQRVDSIVVACNTSAAIALPAVQRRSTLPIFDLIVPTSAYVSRLKGKVGIVATASTVNSRAFSRSIASFDPDKAVVEIACPDLVPIIERGEISQPSTKDLVRKYAKQLIAEEVDVLIWGCTHFPFLEELFKELLPKQLIMVDPANVLLEVLGIDKDTAPTAPSVAAPMDIYVTGNTNQFAQVANLYLGSSLSTVRSISQIELSASDNAANIPSKKSSATKNIAVAPAPAS